MFVPTPCIDVINYYFGRPELPVGAPVKGSYMPDDWHKEIEDLMMHEKKINR